jgi:hypothetical protein
VPTKLLFCNTSYRVIAPPGDDGKSQVTRILVGVKAWRLGGGMPEGIPSSVLVAISGPAVVATALVACQKQH